jgi:hypothetical protein
MSLIGEELLVCVFMSTVFTILLLLGAQRIVPIRDGWLGSLAKLPAPIAVWLRGIILFFLMFVAGDLVVLLHPYAVDLFSYLMKTMGLKGIQLATGPLVIIVGIIAYWFKKTNQLAYGAVEVVIAGVTGIVTSRQVGPGASIPPIMATLVAAVYVVSRGVGNYEEGRAKSKKGTLLSGQVF